MSTDGFEKKVDKLASKKARLLLESAALAEGLRDAAVKRLSVILGTLTQEERTRTLKEMHSSRYDVETYVVYDIFLSDSELRALRTLMHKVGVDHRQLAQLMKNQRVVVQSSDGRSEAFLMHMFNNHSIMLGRTT